MIFKDEKKFRERTKFALSMTDKERREYYQKRRAEWDKEIKTTFGTAQLPEEQKPSEKKLKKQINC